jgi:integrase
MTPLASELDRYLAIRRSLGYRLETAERILRRFVAFGEGRGATHVTTALFLQWKESFGHAHQTTWAARLRAVRLFAQWVHGIDPCHEVPPRGLIPDRGHRGPPYIFTDQEVERIVAAAERLPSVNGVRALTYSTLFGLIAVTGLRIHEALALDHEDVDLESGVLTIRHGKFGKQRLVPVSDSVGRRLELYARERDRLLQSRPRSFFADEAGRRVGDCGARYNFAAIGQQIGLRPSQKFRRHGRGPRIHDLRHTFAVRTIIGWYRRGLDPEREMPKLTTCLGHADPVHTYWYLEAVPELLQLAAERASQRHSEEGRP